MPSKSKNKGNVFERQVADHLGQVFGFNFERVPNSGAFVGGKNNTRYENLSKSQQLIYEGDILVPDELDHLKIECKNYKEFLFHHMFTVNKTLDSWIEQAISDVKTWFLVIKVTRKGTFVLMSENTFMAVKDVVSHHNYMKYNDYYIVTYTDFFEESKDVILSLRDAN
jgi:hypothetical protein